MHHIAGCIKFQPPCCGISHVPGKCIPRGKSAHWSPAGQYVNSALLPVWNSNCHLMILHHLIASVSFAGVHHRVYFPSSAHHVRFVWFHHILCQTWFKSIVSIPKFTRYSADSGRGKQVSVWLTLCICPKDCISCNVIFEFIKLKLPLSKSKFNRTSQI